MRAAPNAGKLERSEVTKVAASYVGLRRGRVPAQVLWNQDGLERRRGDDGGTEDGERDDHAGCPRDSAPAAASVDLCGAGCPGARRGHQAGERPRSEAALLPDF